MTEQERLELIEELLYVTDSVALRNFKYGTAFPRDWYQYTLDLRAAYNDPLLPIPEQPAYPENN